MQAFDPARQHKENQHTYSLALRPFVEEVISLHFESEAVGGITIGAGGKSVTQLSIDRALEKGGGFRPCPSCNGTKLETIKADGMSYEVPCSTCFGCGGFGGTTLDSAADQGMVCRCGGSGLSRKRWVTVPIDDKRTRRLPNAAYLDPIKERRVYRRRGQPTKRQPNESYDPEHEMAVCTACRGTGARPMDAMPIGGAPQRTVAQFIPLGDTPTADIFRLMLNMGQSRSMLALEVAFGAVGAWVVNRLTEPLTLALWPLTTPGEALMRELRTPAGKRPFRALTEARDGDNEHHRALARLADSSALSLLELAFVHFYAGDVATGGLVERSARQLQAKGWAL